MQIMKSASTLQMYGLFSLNTLLASLINLNNDGIPDKCLTAKRNENAFLRIRIWDSKQIDFAKQLLRLLVSYYHLFALTCLVLSFTSKILACTLKKTSYCFEYGTLHFATQCLSLSPTWSLAAISIALDTSNGGPYICKVGICHSDVIRWRV